MRGRAAADSTIEYSVTFTASTPLIATSVNYLLWVPIVAFCVWLVIWRVKFEVMENAFGLLGLTLVVAAVVLWRLGPDWGGLLHGATHPVVPQGEEIGRAHV